jgi:hypothetical protein
MQCDALVSQLRASMVFSSASRTHTKEPHGHRPLQHLTTTSFLRADSHSDHNGPGISFQARCFIPLFFPISKAWRSARVVICTAANEPRPLAYLAGTCCRTRADLLLPLVAASGKSAPPARTAQKETANHLACVRTARTVFSTDQHRSAQHP